MGMYDNHKMGFETRTYNAHGYMHTSVILMKLCEIRTLEKLEGTVDNRAGYGTQEACDRVAAKCRQMLSEGCDVHYEMAIGGPGAAVIEWQHFKDPTNPDSVDYCSARFAEMGSSFGDIEKNMNLLRKVGRKIKKDNGLTHDGSVASHVTFSSPERVLGSLRRMSSMVEVVLHGNLWIPVTALKAEEVAA